MDLTSIREAALNQLQGAIGLNSLRIQNHIYGCYVVMEDISQGLMTVEDGKLIGSKISFDLSERFEEIGVRFGFLADTKLILEDCLAEYKREWLALLVELSKSHSVDKSDAVEDTINEIIVREIKADDAFFVNAIDTGMLPHEWLDRAISLLTGRALSSPVAVTSLSSDSVPLTAAPSQEEEVPVEDTAITHAHTEKVIHHSTKRKPLASTRRHKEAVTTVVSKKKWLNITRRHHTSK
jgi:hypothetical protein